MRLLPLPAVIDLVVMLLLPSEPVGSDYRRAVASIA